MQEGGFSINPVQAEKPDQKSEAARKLRAVEREFKDDFRELYRIGEKIGHGAYSTVYSGVHKASNTSVAIKLMKNIEYSLAYLLAELKLLQ